MASPLFPYHEKSQHWSCRDGAGTPPGISTPQIISPFSLCQGFTPSPSQSLFSSLLISNQQIHRSCRPGTLAGKILQPWLGFFHQGLFLFCCHFVFSPRLSPCSGSLLEPKLEKSSWNSPGEQKGFCAGGFGGRGCLHCCCLRACFPCAKEHLAVPKSTWPWQSRGWDGEEVAEQGMGSAWAQRMCGQGHRHLPHLPAVQKQHRASQISLHQGSLKPLCLALLLFSTLKSLPRDPSMPPIDEGMKLPDQDVS